MIVAVQTDSVSLTNDLERRSCKPGSDPPGEVLYFANSADKPSGIPPSYRRSKYKIGISERPHVQEGVNEGARGGRYAVDRGIGAGRQDESKRRARMIHPRAELYLAIAVVPCSSGDCQEMDGGKDAERTAAESVDAERLGRCGGAGR